MQQRKKLNHALGVAALAMLFGAGATHAQTESSKDASGMTQENKAGKMSPTGQNETTSATPAPAGSSGTSGASGAAASGKDGSGAQSSSGSSDASAGAAKSGAGKAMSKADQTIMRDLAQSNLAEIEAGKLALSQSKSDEVKTFAQKMVDDHTQSQKDLEQLAQAKGVTLPAEPDRKHKAAVKKLGALEGEKFDKRYMSQGGVKDHRETHRLLSRAQGRASDAELKALVAKMAPVVSEHMKMAQDMQGGKGTATGSSTGAGGTSKSKAGAPDASGSSGTSGAPGGAAPGK